MPLCVPLFALLTSGCIVPEAPSYDPPRTTKPLVDAFKAIPSNIYPVPLPKDSTVEFDVPVRSEDAGDELWVGVYLDYGTGRQVLHTDTDVSASTLDDDNRFIEFQLREDALPMGCHTLTLLVTHRANTFRLPSGERAPDLQKAAEDLGVGTWFLNVVPNESNPVTLYDCPARNQGPT